MLYIIVAITFGLVIACLSEIKLIKKKIKEIEDKIKWF
jgi:hypothetical protein